MTHYEINSLSWFCMEPNESELFSQISYWFLIVSFMATTLCSLCHVEIISNSNNANGTTRLATVPCLAVVSALSWKRTSSPWLPPPPLSCGYSAISDIGVIRTKSLGQQCGTFIGPVLSITCLVLQAKVYKVTDSLAQHLFYCQQVNAESQWKPRQRQCCSSNSRAHKHIIISPLRGGLHLNGLCPQRHDIPYDSTVAPGQISN